MGTAKRERQKANRQLGRQEQAKEVRRDKTKRMGLRLGIGIPLAIAVLWGIVLLVNRGNDTTTTPSTSTVAAATPVTAPGASIKGETPCPAADGSSPQTMSFENAPPNCLDPTKSYEAVITTNKGEMTVALDAVNAPLTVNNFVVLARYHYFDDTNCHRIIPDFAAQCGDPTATGTGGPGYTFADELPASGAYKVGSVAMANSGPNTNGSQFFIITGADGAALPPNYSLFGEITQGLDDTVKALNAAGNPDAAANGVPPLEDIVILSVTINEI